MIVITLTKIFSNMTRIASLPSLLLLASPSQYSAIVCVRGYSSSSKRWVARQRNDVFTREAKVQQFKSRAAFKLLEATIPHDSTLIVVEWKIPHLSSRTDCHRLGNSHLWWLTFRALHQDPGHKLPFQKPIPMDASLELIFSLVQHRQERQQCKATSYPNTLNHESKPI